MPPRSRTPAHLRVSLLALLALPGCAPVEPVDAEQQAIIGGTREMGNRAVVAILRVRRSGASFSCSGTVIGTRAVLTAKHCVATMGRVLGPGRHRIAVGHDATRMSGIEYTRDVAEVHVATPGPFTSADATDGTDIAILITTADIGVTPIEVARGRPRPGNDLTLVGFGRTTPTGGAGRKYRGGATVFAIFAPAVFEARGTASACNGDSGGPAFDAAGRVIGVASFTVEQCMAGRSFYSETAFNLAFIESVLGMTPCTSIPETCNGVNDDCDGFTDEGCVALGERCFAHRDCEMGTCQASGMTFVCVRNCDPSSAMPGCPAGFVCDVTGCATGRCMSAVAGTAPDGAPCISDRECASNYCFDRPGGTALCARQCRVDGDACPMGQICDDGGLPCGGCRPPDEPDPLPYGAACDGTIPCEGGPCEDGVCTIECTGHGACPPGNHCEAGFCRPGAPIEPGEPCTGDELCASSAPDCVDVDGRDLCLPRCEDGMCAMGECIDGHCVPGGLGLGETCTASDECRSLICAGTCTRVCDELRTCPEGFMCSRAGDVSGCFPVPEEPEPVTDDGGCGCSAGAEREPGGLLTFVVLVWVAFRRRRRPR